MWSSVSSPKIKFWNRLPTTCANYQKAPFANLLDLVWRRTLANATAAILVWWNSRFPVAFLPKSCRLSFLFQHETDNTCLQSSIQVHNFCTVIVWKETVHFQVVWRLHMWQNRYWCWMYAQTKLSFSSKPALIRTRHVRRPISAPFGGQECYGIMSCEERIRTGILLVSFVGRCGGPTFSRLMLSNKSVRCDVRPQNWALQSILHENGNRISLSDWYKNDRTTAERVSFDSERTFVQRGSLHAQATTEKWHMPMKWQKKITTSPSFDINNVQI